MELREQIEQILGTSWIVDETQIHDNYDLDIEKATNRILAIPELAIVDREAGLPDSPFREQVFDLVTDSPCYVDGAFCEFWDMQGHYCFLKNVHKTSDKCPLIDQILALVDKEAGYRLIPDVNKLVMFIAQLEEIGYRGMPLADRVHRFLMEGE